MIAGMLVFEMIEKARARLAEVYEKLSPRP
jgi:hypothetical protein